VNQDNLQLRIGGKLDPVVTMRSWHSVSVARLKLRSIPHPKFAEHLKPPFGVRLETGSRC
jgi:hypothetical protein